jgi:hypothetical protein
MSALFVADGVLDAQQHADLAPILRLVGEYTTDYHTRLRTLVMDEDYVQQLGRVEDLPSTTERWPLSRVGDDTQQRILRSEFMIVRGLEGENSWLAFRDVFEVNGRPVAGSRGRLEALLTESRATLAERTRALAIDQAKYNLGDVFRTINVPTLPLEFLLPEQQPRFRFRTAGTAVVNGTTCVVINYDEQRRPTLIRTPNGDDVVARGRFWVEASTGRIWKTDLRPGDNSPGRVRSQITVTYGVEPRLGLLVPIRMDETYFLRQSQISATARYSNFRRFETEARIVR